MLKKIRVDQVRLGMHLHALEGAWMDHPFWKTRFVIRDEEQLRKLQDSVVREVWIDPDKGLDLAEDGPAALPTPMRTPMEIPEDVYAAKVDAVAGCDVLCSHLPPHIPMMVYDTRAGRYERGSAAVLDAIGRWRTHESGKEIDASGGLPDGSTFTGVDGLQKALMARPASAGSSRSAGWNRSMTLLR